LSSKLENTGGKVTHVPQATLAHEMQHKLWLKIKGVRQSTFS
jgi:hypothetical protein